MLTGQSKATMEMQSAVKGLAAQPLSVSDVGAAKLVLEATQNGASPPPASASSELVGTGVADYIPVKKLGEGASGSVHLARLIRYTAHRVKILQHSVHTPVLNIVFPCGVSELYWACHVLALRLVWSCEGVVMRILMLEIAQTFLTVVTPRDLQPILTGLPFSRDGSLWVIKKVEVS